MLNPLNIKIAHFQNRKKKNERVIGLQTIIDCHLLANNSSPTINLLLKFSNRAFNCVVVIEMALFSGPPDLQY